MGAERTRHGHGHCDALHGHLLELAIDCGIDALLPMAPASWEQVR